MRPASKPSSTAAGGDEAPDLVKRVLVSRNNTAVAEAEFMMKLFTENVGAAPAPHGPRRSGPGAAARAASLSPSRPRRSPASLP